MRYVASLVGALVIACGTATSPSPSPAANQATERPQTSPPAAATAPPAGTSPGRSPTASRNPAHAEVYLRWDAGAMISDVDDVSDIITHLKNIPGIVDGFGNEAEITILYDPQLITVDRIRHTLEDMGFPTRSPSP